jgi:hypothetical protein
MLATALNGVESSCPQCPFFPLNGSLNQPRKFNGSAQMNVQMYTKFKMNQVVHLTDFLCKPTGESHSHNFEPNTKHI